MHMHAAWQARTETPHRAHDVDTLELVARGILFKDRCILDGVFVRSRGAIDVSRVRIPRCWRIGMIVRDFAVANHHVMRQDAAHRLGEAASDSIFGNRELLPGLGASVANFFQRLLDEVQRASARIGLEVAPRAVAFDSVAPRGNLPFETDRSAVSRLGKMDLHAVTGGFYIADI